MILFAGIIITLKDRRKRSILGAEFYKSHRDTQSLLSIVDERMVKETGAIYSTVSRLGFEQTLTFVSFSTRCLFLRLETETRICIRIFWFC